MKKQHTPESGRFRFSRLALRLFGTMLVPVVLVWLVLAAYNFHNEEKRMQEKQEAQLSLLSSGLESYFSRVESAAITFARSDMVQDSFADKEYGTEYIKQYKLLKALGNEKMLMGHISECYYVNLPVSLVLSDVYGHMKLDRFYRCNDIEEILSTRSRSGWGMVGGRLAYVQFWPISVSGEPQGLLCFYIDEEKLVAQYDQQFVLYPSSLCVYSGNGRLLHMGDEENEKRHAAEEALVAAGRRQTVRMDGFSYAVERSLSRTYVMSASSSPAFFPGLAFTLILPVLVVSVGISLIIALSNARRVETPLAELRSYALSAARMDSHSGETDEITLIQNAIEQLSSDTRAVEDYVSRIQPGVRQSLVRQALENNCGLYPDYEQRALAAGLPMESWYVVLAVSTNMPADSAEALQLNRTMLYRAVDSHLREICKNSPFRGVALSGNNLAYATVVLCFDKNEEKSRVCVLATACGQRLRQELAEALSQDVLIGFGRICTRLDAISLSLQEARMALTYHDHASDKRLFYYVHLRREDRDVSSVIYPMQAEEVLLSALRSGDVSVVEEAFQTFNEQLSLRLMPYFVREAYRLLLMRILNQLVQENADCAQTLLSCGLTDECFEIQDVKAFPAFFKERVFPLYASLCVHAPEILPQTGVRKTAYAELAVSLIQNEMASITLDSAAHAMDISSSYLSRCFTAKYGISFNEYLTNQRVEAAKKMLKEKQQQSMGEIAQIIGYSERNFIRVFQKKTGLTPSQYRQKHNS